MLSILLANELPTLIDNAAPCFAKKTVLRPVAQTRSKIGAAAIGADTAARFITPRKKRKEHPAETDSPIKKARPQKAPAEPNADSGSVHATDLQHRQRHAGQPGSEKCCRCNFILHKAELARDFPWCTQRPTLDGGPWRLGCAVCRWMGSVQGRVRHAQPGRRGSETRASKFARHEVVYNEPYWQMHALIQQHATHTGHRAAVIDAKRVSLLPPARLSQDPEHTVTEQRDTEFAKEAQQCATEAVSEAVHDKALLKGRSPEGTRLDRLLG